MRNILLIKWKKESTASTEGSSATSDLIYVIFNLVILILRWLGKCAQNPQCTMKKHWNVNGWSAIVHSFSPRSWVTALEFRECVRINKSAIRAPALRRKALRCDSRLHNISACISNSAISWSASEVGIQRRRALWEASETEAGAALDKLWIERLFTSLGASLLTEHDCVTVCRCVRVFEVEKNRAAVLYVRIKGKERSHLGAKPRDEREEKKAFVAASPLRISPQD